MATAPSLSAAAGADDSLETMLARVNFYESSVEQIKKEFPKYLQHLADTERSHSAMSKVLKSVASAEPNTVLQYVMFLYAQKEEMLAREQLAYKERIAEVRTMLDSWTKLIIHPIRDVIADHQFQLKTTSPVPALVPDSTLSHPSGNADGSPPPAAGASPGAAAGKKSPAVAASLKTLLPVHMKLFEKHRLKEMKILLRSMLQNEVQYHAKALEAYAQLLECIADADERDGNLPI